MNQFEMEDLSECPRTYLMMKGDGNNADEGGCGDESRDPPILGNARLPMKMQLIYLDMKRILWLK